MDGAHSEALPVVVATLNKSDADVLESGYGLGYFRESGIDE